MGSNLTGVLTERGNLNTETDTHRGKVMWRNSREMPCKDRGEDWNYVCRTQELSGADQLQDARKALSGAGVRGRGAANTLTLGFWPPEPWDNLYSSIQFVEPGKLTQAPTMCHASKRDTNLSPRGEYILVQRAANYVNHSFIGWCSHHHHQLEQLP